MDGKPAWSNYALNLSTSSAIGTPLNAAPSVHPRGNVVVTPAGQLEALVENPAGTALVWEHFERSVGCGSLLQPTHTAASHNSGTHTGAVNILFCDGHVKRTMQSQIRKEMLTWWQETTE